MVELNSIIKIINALEVVPDILKFDPDKSFKENGLDSLDTMSVFLAVEEEFGIKFNAAEAERINTAHELVRSINACNDRLPK